MKIKLLDDLKSLWNAPHDTAVAREALSKALTGRVLPDSKPYLCPICGKWDGCKHPQPKTDKEKEK